MGTNNNHFANFLHLVAMAAHLEAGDEDLAEDHGEAYETGVTPPPVCGACSKLATRSAVSEVLAEGWGEEDATVHACDEHARFMRGWLQDMEHEAHCESMEARAISEREMDYYAGYE